MVGVGALGDGPTSSSAPACARPSPTSRASSRRRPGCGTASRRPSSTMPGDPADAAIYPGLATYLKQVEQERGTGGNRLFYVSTPPSLYPHLVTRLGEAGLNRPPEGSQRLGAHRHREAVRPRPRLGAGAQPGGRLARSSEDQVYRIDHYLGKETVQNILVFRFANGIFEPLWNRNHVDHVQITVGEALGVEGRGAYYEEAGALRDMIQNHMLQLLCLVAMEPPVTFDADPVRDEKVKVLRAIRPDRGRRGGPRRGARPVRARLRRRPAGGGLPRGEGRLRRLASPRPTRRSELDVDNWRWAGVPFYLRTGKRLPKRATEIAVQFKRTPHLRVPAQPGDPRRAQPARAPHPARRGHVALVRRQAARAPSCGSSRWRWTSTTARPSAASRPKPTSACCSTR